MKRLRILPTVAAAAACLLTLKGVAILRSLDEAETPPAPAAKAPEPPAFARALARARPIIPPDDPDITGAVPAKPKPEAAAPAPAPPPASAPSATAQTAQAAQGLVDPGAKPSSERAILERLGERREEIEGRAREMDTREALLRAAEKKLDARVNELRAQEERTQQAQERSEQSPSQAMKNLVTMYETMKPKEAARVFDRLDHKVLLPVVQKMNPRKMAEILAAMSPEAAERLTIAIATRSDSPAEPAGNVGAELPRLDAPARPQAAAAPAPARR